MRTLRWSLLNGQLRLQKYLIFWLGVWRVVCKGLGAELRDKRRWKVLVFVPGLGCSSRARNLATSLRIIFHTKRSLEVSCVVGTYVPWTALSDASSVNLEQQTRNAVAYITSSCQVQQTLGAHYADFIKSINPLLVSQAGFSYVVLLLDDVQLPRSFHFSGFIRKGSIHNLDIFSPAVEGAWQPTTKPSTLEYHLHAQQVVQSKLIEVFLTAHSVRGWSCYWSCTDPIQLSKGWGTDLLVYNYCREQAVDFRMGVLQSFVVVHSMALVCRNASSTQDSRSLSNAAQYQQWKDSDTSGMVRFHLN